MQFKYTYGANSWRNDDEELRKGQSTNLHRPTSRRKTCRDQCPVTKEVDKSGPCAVNKRWSSKNRRRHPGLDCEFRIPFVHSLANGPQGLVDFPLKG